MHAMGGLICSSNLRWFLEFFADFILLFDEQNLPLHFCENLLQAEVALPEEIICLVNDEIEDNFAHTEQNSSYSGKYSETRFYLQILQKVNERRLLLVRDTNGVIVNPFFNKKIADHLLKDLAPFYPLWSSCFKERTTNSNVECWNKILKKDLLKGEKGIRPGTVVRMTRSHTLSLLKLSSLEIRQKPPKKDPVEVWKPKKGTFPGYFTLKKKDVEQNLECLQLPSHFQDIERLKLTNIVLLNILYIKYFLDSG